jgi:hypothetical protein
LWFPPCASTLLFPMSVPCSRPAPGVWGFFQ